MFTFLLAVYKYLFSIRIYIQLSTVPQLIIQGLKFDISLFFSLSFTALHISAYLAIISCVEIRGNCCVFHATATVVFIFTALHNEVNIGPPSVPHILTLFGMPVACHVCSFLFQDVSVHLMQHERINLFVCSGCPVCQKISTTGSSCI